MIQKQKSFFSAQKYTLISLVLFFGFVFFAGAQGGIFVDRDKDGLSDQEEQQRGTNPLIADTDGDSYSDGVEVESGYDPLKPAPGDRIVAERKVALANYNDTQNLTDHVTQDFNSFIAQSISEQKEEINTGDLNRVVETSLAEAITFDQLTPIDPKTIRIKSQSYANLSADQKQQRRRDDAIAYFSDVSFIVTSNMPDDITGVEDFNAEIEDLIKKINASSDTSAAPNEMRAVAQDILTELSAVTVPEELTLLHIKGLQLLQYGLVLRRGSSTQTSADPLATTLYYSQVLGLLRLSDEFVGDVEKVITRYNIDDLSNER